MCDLFDRTGNVSAQQVATLTGIVEAYEAEQGRVCAEVPPGSTADGALARYTPTVDDFVAGDWKHPSVTGLARVAAAAWPVVERLLGLR